VSTVPVLDDDRRVVGVVTSADLLSRTSGDRGTVPRGHWLAASTERAHKRAGRTAKDIMTSPAVTAHAADSILDTARSMARARVRCLPVVDDDGTLRNRDERSMSPKASSRCTGRSTGRRSRCSS
jgi:CBS domain-containing protein